MTSTTIPAIMPMINSATNSVIDCLSCTESKEESIPDQSAEIIFSQINLIYEALMINCDCDICRFYTSLNFKKPTTCSDLLETISSLSTLKGYLYRVQEQIHYSTIHHEERNPV